MNLVSKILEILEIRVNCIFKVNETNGMDESMFKNDNELDVALAVRIRCAINQWPLKWRTSATRVFQSAKCMLESQLPSGKLSLSDSDGTFKCQGIDLFVRRQTELNFPSAHSLDSDK